MLDAPRITLHGEVDGAVDEKGVEFGQYLCRKHRWRQERETRRAQLKQRSQEHSPTDAPAAEVKPAVPKPAPMPKRVKLTLKKEVMA